MNRPSARSILLAMLFAGLARTEPDRDAGHTFARPKPAMAQNQTMPARVNGAETGATRPRLRPAC